MLIGYARVSTGELNLDMPVNAFNDDGCDVIYSDEVN